MAAKGKTPTQTGDKASPAELIDGRIKELGDWRGDMLARTCS